MKSGSREIDEDDTSTIMPSRKILPEDDVKQSSVSTSQFDFLVESALRESRAYARLTHRHSVSSIPSDSGSLTGLSFLSGISLAQVSDISVISLPIFHHEILNPQNYSAMTEHSSRSVGATSMLDPESRPQLHVLTEQLTQAESLSGSEVDPPASSRGLDVITKQAQDTESSVATDVSQDSNSKRPSAQYPFTKMGGTTPRTPPSRPSRMLEFEGSIKATSAIAGYVRDSRPTIDLLLFGKKHCSVYTVEERLTWLHATGVSRSGKSTILKQIRKGCEPESSSPLHSLAFSFAERQEHRRIICQNIADSFLLTLDCMERHDLRFKLAASDVCYMNGILRNHCLPLGRTLHA